MKETQLQDIRTIYLLMAEGWGRALCILSSTPRGRIPVAISFPVAGEVPLRSSARSLAGLHRRCHSRFKVARGHVWPCLSSMCRVTARLVSQGTGFNAPSPEHHQHQKGFCDVNGQVCPCTLPGTGTGRWVPSATWFSHKILHHGEQGEGLSWAEGLVPPISFCIFDREDVKAKCKHMPGLLPLWLLQLYTSTCAVPNHFWMSLHRASPAALWGMMVLVRPFAPWFSNCYLFIYYFLLLFFSPTCSK